MEEWELRTTMSWYIQRLLTREPTLIAMQTPTTMARPSTAATQPASIPTVATMIANVRIRLRYSTSIKHPPTSTR